MFCFNSCSPVILLISFPRSVFLSLSFLSNWQFSQFLPDSLPFLQFLSVPLLFFPPLLPPYSFHFSFYLSLSLFSFISHTLYLQLSYSMFFFPSALLLLIFSLFSLLTYTQASTPLLLLSLLSLNKFSLILSYLTLSLTHSFSLSPTIPHSLLTIQSSNYLGLVSLLTFSFIRTPHLYPSLPIYHPTTVKP